MKQEISESLSDAGPALQERELFFNRELSWLEFNRRVLGEALDPSNPLLERIRFLSIFGSNLDEFFMLRVSGLRDQLAAGVVEPPPDGRSPAEQLAEIRELLLPVLEEAGHLWDSALRPALEKEGIEVLHYEQLEKGQKRLLRRYFKKEISPILTPLALDPGHPFPHISNLSLNLAVVVEDPHEGEKFARLKVPQSLPRLLRIPDEESAESLEPLGLGDVQSPTFVWMEDVIAANLERLFPGLKVKAAYPFRVTRDADQELEEDEAADLLTAMAEIVEQRRFGSVVRLEVNEGLPERIRDILLEHLGVVPYQVYSHRGPIGVSSLAELVESDRPDLKWKPFHPTIPGSLGGEENVFSVIRRRDVVLYHPYESFVPVLDFLREAASDPDVLAIKQTLYRVGLNSPVVEALMEARANGKQVSVLVELKARFDEERNIVWARALEQAGVHVVYGVVGLKTHAKILLVVRREAEGVRRYVHLATGNYNPVTAKVYTDLGYFTADSEITKDTSDLFNALTGYSRKTEYRKLLVAPGGMRDEILERIERETEHAKNSGTGYLAFKLNSLTDKRCIEALYRASQAGVEVDLQIRGICCLRPGVSGLSERIRVTSIVGRFLEHARVYHFRNGGEDEVFLGSADLMPRNLDGRVEVLFPVGEAYLGAAIRDHILGVHLGDTAKLHRLLPDGSYQRPFPADNIESSDSQACLLAGDRPWQVEE
ncbi:MAG: polyphosphate kinase 1 [Acidobacteriota bacterium]|nr:polyphosphate kinase 1 [Acidobacteriota bacterium]